MLMTCCLPRQNIVKFQTVRRGLAITIGLSPSSSTSVNVLPTQGDLAPPNAGVLRPTTEDLLKECPRLRVLVIGQSGVGKSTLISKVFGIEQTLVEDDAPEQAGIEKELVSPQNATFVLHESEGFEPADCNNYNNVKSFLES
ncbi:hypothetical protein EDC04DRAFT_771708 [Pisolithus marmoratus]|nr:hypothetical protein EDC04DRAFT_771708 [Pisolithus marmoratus]